MFRLIKWYDYSPPLFFGTKVALINFSLLSPLFFFILSHSTPPHPPQKKISSDPPSQHLRAPKMASNYPYFFIETTLPLHLSLKVALYSPLTLSFQDESSITSVSKKWSLIFIIIIIFWNAISTSIILFQFWTSWFTSEAITSSIIVGVSSIHVT